jgi:uncharacterized RDD family membrane protein YckC
VTATQVRGVVTAEAVVLEFETASVASRSLALILDFMVRFGLFYALAYAALALSVATNVTVAYVLLVVGGFLIVFGYPVLLEVRWNGQTIGKRVIGLRVLTLEGAPVRFRHAAIRSVMFTVDLVFGAGVSLLNKHHQRLGDLFAGTIVLREKTGAAFPIPVSFPPLRGFELYARSLDVGSVTPEQYAVIRSFLIRVHTLTPAARSHIGTRLANAVAIGMHHTPPAQVTPEIFLVSVAAAYQLRQGGPPVPLPPWIPQWGVEAAPATMGR